MMNPQLYAYRYITTNGQPPNGGFPPARSMRRTPSQQPYCYLPTFQPPGPPPPYTVAPSVYRCFGSCCSPASCPPVAHSRLTVPPPIFISPPAPPNRPAPPQGPHDPEDPSYPPGARLDGFGIRFPNGSGFIFPELCCTIHLVEKGIQPWRTPGARFKWKAFKVPTRLTINELIRQLGARDGARAETPDLNFGIVEIKESGDGIWLKGSEFRLTEEQSFQTLEEVGWSENRGQPGGSRPIWLAIIAE